MPAPRKAKTHPRASLVPVERIERAILLLRGHKVMLDADLAALYGVETRVLVQAVKRNADRFPDDFMFQLTAEEHRILRSQSVTSNVEESGTLRLLSGTSKGRGGRRYPPYAFTEQGVAMLSTVLRSPRAIHVNIEIMRAFVRLRSLLQSHEELSRKLDELERRYDQQFQVVFEAIRAIMAPPSPGDRRIGFRADGDPES